MPESIQYTKSINFDYSPYDEDLVVTGAKGSRKTSLVRDEILPAKLSNCAYWIWDFSSKFHGWGNLVDNIDDLQYGQYVIDAKDKSLQNFQRFLDKLFYGAQSGEYTNTVLIVDELHQYVKKQSVLQELANIVLSARNFGISGIYIATTPQSVPNFLLSNMTHVISFRQGLKSNLVWLHDYIGIESWLLVTQDRRNELQAEPDLPVGSYIYRDLKKTQAEVFVNNDTKA